MGTNPNIQEKSDKLFLSNAKLYPEGSTVLLEAFVMFLSRKTDFYNARGDGQWKELVLDKFKMGETIHKNLLLTKGESEAVGPVKKEATNLEDSTTDGKASVTSAVSPQKIPKKRNKIAKLLATISKISNPKCMITEKAKRRAAMREAMRRKLKEIPEMRENKNNSVEANRPISQTPTSTSIKRTATTERNADQSFNQTNYPMNTPQMMENRTVNVEASRSTTATTTYTRTNEAERTNIKTKESFKPTNHLTNISGIREDKHISVEANRLITRTPSFTSATSKRNADQSFNQTNDQMNIPQMMENRTAKVEASRSTYRRTNETEKTNRKTEKSINKTNHLTNISGMRENKHISVEANRLITRTSSFTSTYTSATTKRNADQIFNRTNYQIYEPRMKKNKYLQVEATRSTTLTNKAERN